MNGIEDLLEILGDIPLDELSNVDIPDVDLELDLPLDEVPLDVDSEVSQNTGISFGSATPYQDSCYTGFKDWLEYHCNIYNYEIPYREELVTSNGDYNRSVISKLENWVRDLYANDKISSYDRDELFRKLSGMKG